MTLAEQIKSFQLRKQQAIERQKAMNALIAGEGRSFDDEEEKEFDELTAECAKIDGTIVRLQHLEKMDGATATPPAAAKPGVKGAPAIIRGTADKPDEFKGQSFVRRVIAKTLAQLEGFERTPGQIAEQRWGKTNPTLVAVIKAGVAGGSSASGAWGAELVQADGRFTGDFVEYLNSITVYDRLALRPVPANVTIKGQDGAATGYWVGQSKSIPATTIDTSAVSLTPLKVAAIAVCSNELLRDSSPAAEMLIRDSLAEASAQRIDTTFLGTGAISAGVSPAGILNGILSLGSNGYDGAAVRADLRELYAPFISAKIPTNGIVLVMHPNLATALSLMANALGQDEFPDIGPDGGTLRRIPVVTGHNVGATRLIMLKPSEIWKIGDTGVEVSVSREATIEQDGVPQGDSENPTAASATLMSMFGTESTAFKVVRSINYQKRRAAAVSFIGDAQYGDSTSTTS